jgi:hypothetical protein
MKRAKLLCVYVWDVKQILQKICGGLWWRIFLHMSHIELNRLQRMSRSQTTGITNSPCKEQTPSSKWWKQLASLTMMALPTIFGMKFVGSVAIFANPQIFFLIQRGVPTRSSVDEPRCNSKFLTMMKNVMFCVIFWVHIWCVSWILLSLGNYYVQKKLYNFIEDSEPLENTTWNSKRMLLYIPIFLEIDGYVNRPLRREHQLVWIELSALPIVNYTTSTNKEMQKLHDKKACLVKLLIQ